MGRPAQRLLTMHDVADIKKKLIDKIELLLTELFPAGRFERGEFRVGDVNGSPGRSLVVTISGERAGLWYDHSGASGGDLIDLVAAASSDGEIAAALRWCRRWLRLPVRAHQDRRPSVRRYTAEDELRLVKEIWNGAMPIQRGDPVARYLAGRGIELERLSAANGGRLPAVLRCHRLLWNRESRRALPALVAAIQTPDGALWGVHRTWLSINGNGEVHKATLEVPKASLGHYRGGAIRLWRGASGRPWNEAPKGDILAISEGIEDGLSVAMVQPAWRVAAAVSLSAMLSIVIPARVEILIVVKQNDPPRSRAAATLEKVRTRFRSEGKRLFLLQPPYVAKDVNDVLRRWRRASRAIDDEIDFG
jgi:hypothetical protein